MKQANQTKPQTTTQGCFVIVVVVLIIYFIMKSCGGGNSDMTSEAFIIAKDYVESSLKAPATADFSSDYSYKKEGDNTFIIQGEVDSENSFGAKLRSNWRVKLKYNGGEWTDKNNWTLLNISIQ